MSAPISIVVLISGGGTNLQALIDSISAGHIHAKIKAVIANIEDAYGLTRAEDARIPTEVLDHQKYADRDEFDRELSALIDHYNPDLVVLSGFMRKLGAEFTERYTGRMLNIHPSLLPKYPGLNTHKRALANHDTQHGASIHFVTAELDAGPLVIQAIVEVKDDDDEETLARRVHREEHIIYPMVIGWFAEGRLTFVDNEPHFDGLSLTTPIIRQAGVTQMPSNTASNTPSNETD